MPKKWKLKNKPQPELTQKAPVGATTTQDAPGLVPEKKAPVGATTTTNSPGLVPTKSWE